MHYDAPLKFAALRELPRWPILGTGTVLRHTHTHTPECCCLCCLSHFCQFLTFSCGKINTHRSFRYLPIDKIICFKHLQVIDWADLKPGYFHHNSVITLVRGIQLTTTMKIAWRQVCPITLSVFSMETTAMWKINK